MRLGIAGIFCVWTQQGYSAVRHCAEDQESIDFSKSKSPLSGWGRLAPRFMSACPDQQLTQLMRTADALKSVRLAMLVLQMLASVSAIISADQTKFQSLLDLCFGMSVHELPP